MVDRFPRDPSLRGGEKLEGAVNGRNIRVFSQPRDSAAAAQSGTIDVLIRGLLREVELDFDFGPQDVIDGLPIRFRERSHALEVDRRGEEKSF
ncbi:unnamed protein product [Macrosiphum euphorbiae]|uniref:Uncharacterized protein n=1 Tax=Macrosiphum euphorbiae TaxID=13131 RepID=A0AAV0WIL3_9HEMI|nr:unnamed protein product [Macrosiphum euphorbiae]